MKILVACEESQRVCKEFRARGHEAYSCDIIAEGGGRPEWHIQRDVLPLLDGNCAFMTNDGAYHYIEGKWDMIIAFPPCTYLTVTGNRWMDTGKYGDAAWERMNKRNFAIGFFYKFIMAKCDRIAIENPQGIMSTAYRSPDQVIQPWMFGDPFDKRTCLWLKNMPELLATNIVNPGKRVKIKAKKALRNGTVMRSTAKGQK